jgi:ElaB/YqjD/DUF883 family membrane-anchored ribosome-binding protein
MLTLAICWGCKVSCSEREINMETYFKNMRAEEGTKEKLIQDLIILVHDAEDLIRATGENLSEKAKVDLIAALERVKASCHRIEKEAVAVAKTTDRIVRDHPYGSMGIGFAGGLVVGMLLRR